MAPDPRIAEPYRLTPQTLLRAGILGALTLGLFAVLFLRLWSLEVLSSKQYLQTANANQVRSVPITAPRGPILDRFGRTIVTNRKSTAIVIRPADLPKRRDDQRTILKRLEKLTHVPFIEMRRGVDDRLGHGDILTPVVVKTEVNRYLVAYIEENEAKFPGVEIADSYVRAYPWGSTGAHLLGYVTEISREQLKADRKQVYHAGDEIGQAGVERAYDRFLRGQDGLEQQLVNSLGHPVADPETDSKRLKPIKLPRQGYAVRLTIDLRLQQAAETALVTGVNLAQQAHQWYAKGGAIVALDPRDGAIRALASYPTFKPALYTGHATTAAFRRAGLLQDATGAPIAADLNYPALDRATSGIYAPGSTFKPMTAIAAMQAGVLSPGELIDCPGSKEYAHEIFRNWNPYPSGLVNLSKALAISCDTYFYEVGDRIYNLGQAHGHPIQDAAAQFGFGQATGIDVGGEEKGLLPTPEWRIKTYKTEIDKAWKPGDSIQLAIGQKDLRVTPIQMARFYAALANGGKLVTPHVLQYAEQRSGVPLPQSRNLPPAPQAIHLQPGILDAIRAGLWEATHDTNGTSSAIFGSFPIAIAGKTGTAEQGLTHLKDQSWWCGYGPVDRPELVVCALIENGGHGGTAAAPAARMVFERFFHKTGTTTGPVNSD